MFGKTQRVKWLLYGTYRPPNQGRRIVWRSIFEEYLTCFKFQCQKYGKLLLVADVDLEETEPHLSEFLSNSDAKNLVKSEPCFKSPLNPRCSDLFITNSICSFQNTCGLLDFHTMSFTLLKTSFKKLVWVA